MEDHDEVHRVLCDLIKYLGHKTDCVKTIGEALALLVPGSHQLVIADVRLPDGRGYAIAERASALGIKTILMSGHPDEIETLKMGRLMHLAKPFRIEEFKRIIADQLRALPT